MIHLICGPRNSGKTTHLCRLHATLGGAGFLSEKLFTATGQLLGYRVRNLSEGTSMLLALNKEYLPPDWDECCHCGPYSFSAAALHWVNHSLPRIAGTGCSPLFLDEVGPLELQEQGFSPGLRAVLSLQPELYLSVRPTCLQQVQDHFLLAPCQVIRV